MAAEAYKLNAVQALAQIKAGNLTIEQYAQSLLARIKERDETVKAWVYLDPERVLAEARRMDAVPQEQRGPLHGLPVAVKDVISTKGMPTQYGSAIYDSARPDFDAASILILRQAGALLLGKTTTTEFSATTEGKSTGNPHNPTHTPGGSSSGSAAAVADFHAPVALGTQTAGSIIRPAGFCGVFGMKPTWNTISREGQRFCSINLDTLGFFSRSLHDLQLLANVMGVTGDAPPRPLTRGIEGERIAVVKTMVWDRAGPGTRQAMDRGIQLLRTAGAKVEEVTFPDHFARLPDWHQTLMFGDGRSAFFAEHIRARDKLGQRIIDQVETPVSRKDWLEAFDGIAALRPQWDAIAANFTAVIAPSTVDEAPEGLKWTGDQIFNGLWTALHVPVINLPAFKGETGLPVGLSLVGARYQDDALLLAADQVAKVWM